MLRLLLAACLWLPAAVFGAPTRAAVEIQAPLRAVSIPRLAPFVPAGLAPTLQAAQLAPLRVSVSPEQAHEEVLLDPRVLSQVPGSFYSFQDYMDTVLHHPQWGYYTSGRVRFGAEGDFDTYSN